MFDEGNSQLSAVGFYNPMLGGGDAVSAFGGGAGGGGDMSSCFNISGQKIVHCGLAFGRQWLTCDDTQLDVLAEGVTPSGVIYAKIAHASTSVTLSVAHGQDLPENKLDESYRALYYARGESWIDVRYMPTVFAMN